MSCLPGLGRRLSKKELKLANEQKLKFSSPAPRPSLEKRLEEMAVSANRFIRARAASDYQLMPREAKLLREDSDWFVRATLARNEHIGGVNVYHLIRDEAAVVRGFAVLNRNALWDDIEEAAEFDPSDEVRGLARWRILTRESESGKISV